MGLLRRRKKRDLPDGAWWSAIHPVQHEQDADSDLLSLCLDSARFARTCDLRELAARAKPDRAREMLLWPGEHYRLLAGLVSTLKPRRIIEVGTETGASALVMKQFLPPEGKITTFDIVPWSAFSNSVLVAGDFADARLEQRVEDPTMRSGFERNRTLFEEADMFFVDAAKDGKMEDRILAFLYSLPQDKQRILVLDDIRLMTMISTWRSISLPKLDMTSLGHWTGTGIVRLTSPEAV